MDKESQFKEMMEHPKVTSWVHLLKAYQCIHAVLDNRLNKVGCSISRFQIFINLYFRGSLRPVEMAKILNVSRANITTFIKRLVADDLIEADVKGGTEKRPAYRLTNKGFDYFEEIFPSHIEEVKSNLLPFPPEFLALLSEVQQISCQNRDRVNCSNS